MQPFSRWLSLENGLVVLLRYVGIRDAPTSGHIVPVPGLFLGCVLYGVCSASSASCERPGYCARHDCWCAHHFPTPERQSSCQTCLGSASSALWLERRWLDTADC